MAKTITGRPTGGVKNLRLKRNGYRIIATWGVPSALTRDGERRATKMRVIWKVFTSGADPQVVVDIVNMGVTTNALSLTKFMVGSREYTRASFNPVTKLTLPSVRCSVYVGNAKGWSKEVASESFTFERPRKPVIGNFSVTNEGAVSVTVTTDPGIDKYERWWTSYSWVVIDRRTKQVLKNQSGAVRATEFTLSADAGDFQALGTSYVEFMVKARAHGYRGASDEVANSYCLSYPNAPTIGDVDVPSGVTGTVVAHIKTNHSYRHPVTKVQLQALVNTEYATMEEAAAAVGEWDDVGGHDNANCTALAVPVAEVRPTTPGRHSWLRVRSEGAIEGVLVNYSAPKELTALYRDPYSAQGDVVKILNAYAGEDGKSAVVLLGWAPDGAADSSTGTELSWASEQDTWRSTDEPETFNVTYDDGEVEWDGVTYGHSATITIKGLDEGRVTYIRARRYHEGADDTTFGSYCETYTVTPAQIPASVVLEVAGYVAEGSDLTCTWTYDGGATQDAWALVDGSGVVVAGDSNALGTATIPSSRLADLATGGSLSLAVMVSMGGAWVTSEAKRVTIVERPTLTASTAATLTAQPMAIEATCDAPAAQLTVIVTSDGMTGFAPGGIERQLDGDVIWSDVVEPEWAEGACVVTLPEGMDFADGVGYTVRVTATDPATGLASESVELHADVAWSHQAPDPDGCATITPIDEVDDYGTAIKAVRIQLAAPAGSAETDSYDIYRLTGDGAQLIGSGYPLDAEVTDSYAPYGSGMELAYRIACRTADGDVEWADVPYELAGDAMRIDWGGQYVELPYDIAIDDSYAKDMDVHGYFDGSVDAFFNQGVRRSAKLSTSVLRLEDADVIASVLDLAHYAGPAFVRTPTGAAYEAAVQVDSVTPTRELAAVSITAEEVRLTEAYRLPHFNVVPYSETVGEGE